MRGDSDALIRYRGRPVAVRPGETLARALVRHGTRIIQRSIRYHRPRAPACGLGFCTNCLVRVNGQPNVRACRYEPEAGDRIETENSWPSPRFDALGVLDRIFYRGFDSHRTFIRPSWAAPLYHWIVRRMAGFGRLPDAPVLPPPPSASIDAETLVIGAGPAGLGATERLGSAGSGTVLLERDRVRSPHSGVTVFERTTAVFLPPPRGPPDRPFRVLAIRDGGGGLTVRARRVIAAPGGYNASLVFPGNDRPGVVTAEGAIQLAPAPDAPGFRHAVMVGGGSVAADLLDRFGPSIGAVVTPGAAGPSVARRAAELEIPIYPRMLVVRALGTRGVRAVRLAPRGGGAEFTVGCDAVVMAHRRVPSPQLFFQAGAQMHWRAETGGYYPTLVGGLETTVPGLFAAGEGAGFVESSAVESGRLAADQTLGAAVARLALERVRQDGPNELEGYYRDLLARLPANARSVVCPCEDVLLSELAEASHLGYRGIEVVKRYTGAGTGLCQGRYCLPDALLLLSIWESRTPAEMGYITQRPPVVPAPIGALAGLSELEQSEAV